MPFTNGLQVGPYRILEQLGQGGMATVYKAYHAALDRYVAVKVLHQAFMEDPHFLARFQREARLVARLEHPNIVPIYDYAEYEGQPYLIMKFIEGETLKARLQRGPLNATEVQNVVETVGAALAYAHKQGILAQALIDKLRAIQPGLPEAELLQAELMITTKEDLPGAQKILAGLLQTPNQPQWVIERAKELQASAR